MDIIRDKELGKMTAVGVEQEFESTRIDRFNTAGIVASLCSVVG